MMARARNIKPAFFKNEYLAQLSPHVRLLFIGLWCLADCEGRLEDRPMRIRAELFPFEVVDIEALLHELETCPDRPIVRYENQGSRYLEITGFKKHQSPTLKEKQAGSRIPGSFDLGSNLHDPSLIPNHSQAHAGMADILKPDSLNLITETPSPLSETPQEENEDDFLRELLTDFEKSGNSFQVNSVRPLLVESLAQQTIPPDQIRQAWLIACKVAADNGARTPRYLLKVFKDKLTVPQNDVSHASPPQYSKDGDGRYTFSRDLDPSTDPSIPFSGLSFDCMTRRLTATGLLVNFKPNMEKLDNEDLQIYINEAIHQDASFQTFFSEAIDAIGRMG